MNDPQFDSLIAIIKARMANLEAYEAQNDGGIGNAGGVAGFATVREMLLAKSSLYAAYDELLSVAGIQY